MTKEQIGAAIKELVVLVTTQQAPSDSININEKIGELATKIARAAIGFEEAI